MQKLFHFDCAREVYQADACIISCFDARFDLAVRKFLKRRGILTYDQIKIPGSAKFLATPDTEADRDFVLRMVRVSMRLHRPTRLWMFAHSDCGAYPDTPVETQTADLQTAAQFLRGSEPALAVECFFADFDGIYSGTSMIRTCQGQTELSLHSEENPEAPR
jgi:hypothetical protein